MNTPKPPCCATEEPIDDLLRQIVHDWGAEFPASRFTGRTVETARISVTVDEVLALAQRVADTVRGGVS